jgi:hypothetical protein
LIALRTRGQRLRAVRELRGYKSQGDAAKELGVPLSTYSSYERAQAPGARDFSFEQAQEWSKLLRCDPIWLYTNQGTPPKGIGTGVIIPVDEASKMPVVGYFGVPTGEGGLYGFIAEEVDRPCCAVDETVAVELKGKSLAEGMLAVYHDRKSPLEACPAGMAVFGLDDNKLLIRQVVRKDNLLSLKPYNADETPVDLTSIRWAERIIAIIPR